MHTNSLRALVALFCLGVYTHGNVYAAEATNDAWTSADALNLSLPDTNSASSLSRYEFTSPTLLAANTGGENATSRTFTSMSQSESMAEGYEDRWFTGNKVHKYLGIGSIGAALLTVLAPKEEDGAHEALAKASAALGIGAVATGLVFHFEDISWSGGVSDPDNLHAFFAGLGAVGIALAASKGPDSPHATYGSVGAIGMILGVKYTW